MANSGFLGLFNRNKSQDNKEAMVEKKSYGAQATTLEGFYSGNKKLTEDDILSIPAARNSIEIIGNAFSQMPINLFHNVDSKAGKEIVDDDYRLDLLNTQPNATLDAFSFKRRMAKDMLLYGASKNYIEYNPDGTIKALYPLDMTKLTTTVYSQNGYEYYGIDTLLGNNGATDFYDEMLFSAVRDTNNGIVGRGVIEGNEDTFQLAIRQSEYESNLVGNGAMPTGMVTSEEGKNFTDKVIPSLRQSFKQLYSGSKNAGKTVFLPGGLKYQPLSLNPDDLQLTAGKKSVISDIARIFNIPESMINSAANKYDSAEQNNTWYLNHTLAPFITSIEIAMNRAFLTEEERKAGYEFKFDTSYAIRMSYTDTLTNATNAFKSGLMSNISARRKIGEKIASDETEFFNFTTGSVMYKPESGEIVNPNTGQMMDFETGELLSQGFDNKDSGSSNKSQEENNVQNEDGD